MPFQPTSHPGILHHFSSRLVAFEHTPPSTNPSTTPTKAPATSFILFLGGLGDALLTVRYPSVLAQRLPPHWSVAEVTLSSSGTGWATGNLERDGDELSRAVAYFTELGKSRSGASSAATPGTAASASASPTKIILLGHSTGSQIALSYLIGPWKSPTPSPHILARPPVHATILQAGISDREGVPAHVPPKALAAAQALIREGRPDDVLPNSATDLIFLTSMTARRAVSLFAEDGDDDYFSSDLDDDRVRRVWGADGVAGRRVRVCVLLGERDEHMRPEIDKEALVRRWGEAVRRDGGVWDESCGVVEGATHNLNGASEGAVRGLCERVLGVVGRVDGDAEGEKVGGGRL